MSEEEFTIESIGMEESYCDHSCILRGEEVISDGIPSADARSIVDLLNELSEEKEYFERKKEYFLSKWSIANAENIQLRQENRELKKENENLRKQVKSFETTMNATSDYNAFLESKITTLEKENRELNSIKKFAEKNGINIFLIDEAFRKCWKDNGKLFEENEKLRQELNGKDCRKCGNYCRDKADDYCLVDEREPSYFSFPFKWDYKAEAEKCKYYYR